ncbi:MAG: DUF2811 domain-containing protein [Leptolyngbya sp. SIO4C1]|nr:DUF2811 domain-containing protein [Leptolyngbya sp. SIO4C1]
MASKTVSLTVEIPEELLDSLQGFLETHTAWDQDRVFCAAMSLFLIQNGMNQQQVSRLYLDSLFGCAV